MIKSFEINTEGRDFVVGDIHGMFSLLADQLKLLDFNTKIDRLFSVGDLVDRGPDSADFDKWLGKSWFHAVRGNHDQMVIDSVNDDLRGNASGMHLMNGGSWFFGLPSVEQQCYAVLMEDLPLAIEVETKYGLVGIIHAESPHNDWAIARKQLSTPSDNTKAVAMWARTKINSLDTTSIKGLYKLYVGHTPDNAVRELGNVIYTDTGACFKGGKLTIIQIN